MKLEQISFCSLWHQICLLCVFTYCFVICDKENDYACFRLAVAGCGMNYNVEQTLSSKLADSWDFSLLPCFNFTLINI